MGEAKQRGTYKERVAQALKRRIQEAERIAKAQMDADTQADRERTQVEAFRAAFGLPKGLLKL